MPIKIYTQAINEATDQLLASDKNVVVIGEGVPDGVFGSTKGLKEKYPKQVWDSPISESCVTGSLIGASTNGLKPIQVHQRADFSLLSMDQLCNNAAKWYSTFGKPCPIVIRMIIGRGWGQGPTHSQSPQSLYAAIPGLKVIMPSSPYDAKGMLIAAVRDNNPVIILEHRWLFDMVGDVPEEMYTVPLDKAKIVKQGSDVTIVAMSYATIEALYASKILELNGVSVEVIDLRSCAPLDIETIIESIKKTGRLVCVDTSHVTGSISETIVAKISCSCIGYFKANPVVLGCKNYPQPTSHFLTKNYYPTVKEIVNTCLNTLGKPEIDFVVSGEHDKPNANYSVTF